MKHNFDFNNSNDDINLDLTPLIDVIFMLVIFFVLTTTFAKPIMDMTLPKSTTAQTEGNEEYLIIAIKKDGSYEVENQIVSISELREIITNSPNKTLNIFADKDSSFDSFVTIADLAKELKDGKFVISTDKLSPNNEKQ